MTTITERLRDNKAVYTVAGAGDLAVEKLREMPEQVIRLRETVDKYQDEVKDNVIKFRGEVRENVARLQERVDPADLPGVAVSYVTQIGGRAVEVIDELAERGKKIMTRVERQAATQRLEERAESTKARAKSTRSQAKATVTKAKATAEEAKKTGQAARRAARDAADKVGD